MIFLAVALLAAFLVSKTAKTGPDTGASTPINTNPRPVTNMGGVPPVIKQSTGSSLSLALGNKSRPPAYYSTGTPGTLGRGASSRPPSSTINLAPPKWTPAPVVATVSNPFHGGPISQNAPNPVIKQTEQTAVGVKMVSSHLVNPHQIKRPVVKPEWPGAFWTRGSAQ